MAKVVDKRPNGAVLIEVPAEDAADLEIGAEVEVRPQLASTGKWPAPFGALAGRMSSIEIRHSFHEPRSCQQIPIAANPIEVSQAPPVWNPVEFRKNTEIADLSVG
jgi:hypothetical protein